MKHLSFRERSFFLSFFLSFFAFVPIQAQLSVNSTGNVGIGISDASEKLRVVGNYMVIV